MCSCTTLFVSINGSNKYNCPCCEQPYVVLRVGVYTHEYDMSSDAETLADWHVFARLTGIQGAIDDGDTNELNKILYNYGIIDSFGMRSDRLKVYQPWGTEALRGAMIWGYSGIVKILLDWGVHSGDSESNRLGEMSVLSSACMMNEQHMKRHNVEQPNFPEVVRLLLSRGASVCDYSCNRRTPLHCVALSAGSSGVEVASILLEHGADVNAIDTHGGTPLFVATIKHHYATIEQLKYQTQMAEFLLCHGADPSLACDGQTPLDVARGTGQNPHLIHLLEAVVDFMANEFQDRVSLIEKAFGVDNVEPWIIDNIMQRTRMVDMERIIGAVNDKERS
jgi:Ankyrin repeats (3 copies)